MRVLRFALLTAIVHVGLWWYLPERVVYEVSIPPFHHGASSSWSIELPEQEPAPRRDSRSTLNGVVMPTYGDGHAVYGEWTSLGQALQDGARPYDPDGLECERCHRTAYQVSLTDGRWNYWCPDCDWSTRRPVFELPPSEGHGRKARARR